MIQLYEEKQLLHLMLDELKGTGNKDSSLPYWTDDDFPFFLVYEGIFKENNS